MLAHPFMRNAFLAGTAIAAASGLVGYFVVLRSQVFSADALSHVAFTGALAALAIGLDARVGLFGATVLVGVIASACSATGAGPNDVVIGTVFTGILGVGVLFLSIYTTSGSAANGAANVNVLFGSIFGLGAGAGVRRGGRRRGLVPRGRRASRGRCCSRASTRRSRPRAGCRCARSASCSSRSSVCARRRRRRPSARCCSSGSSRGRPAPRTG